MRYTLQNNDGPVQKSLYQPFIQLRFPSYEVFWQKFVIPLTEKLTNFNMKMEHNRKKHRTR